MEILLCLSRRGRTKKLDGILTDGGVRMRAKMSGTGLGCLPTVIMGVFVVVYIPRARLGAAAGQTAPPIMVKGEAI